VDVHPLDEVQGSAALIELEPDTYTVETIASLVGRSPAYVNGRLRLIQLVPEAKQAFYEDKLTVAHAFEIARLQPLCDTCEDEVLELKSFVFSLFSPIEHDIKSGQFTMSTTRSGRTAFWDTWSRRRHLIPEQNSENLASVAGFRACPPRPKSGPSGKC
jgi:hypothetical protein